MTDRDDALHMTSLQLVGRMSGRQVVDGPWDEVALDTSSSSNSNEIILTAHIHTSTSSIPSNSMDATTLSFDNLSGPDEARWRAHGVARRQQLLEDDRLKGGRTFHVSFGDTSVYRYFSVAHWALEQFHELYQSNDNPEETYVMGFRIVSFLSECLPRHPGFASAPEIKRRAKVELELLKECLEDVALQIDEETCNKFVDEFDPLFVVGDDDDDDDDDDSITESSSSEAASSLTTVRSQQTGAKSTSPQRKSRMVRFENWEELQADMDENEVLDGQKSPESSTTARTSGTSSTEPLDTSYLNSSSDSDSPSTPRLTQQAVERVELDRGVEDPYDYENAAFPSLHGHYFYRQVHLDFLQQIASEEVPFETDSDAADSWAQTPEDVKDYLAPSSSGASPTCDPARIAFRDMMNRLPEQPIVQDMKKAHEQRTSSRRNTDRRAHEQHSENEIQRYLESEQERDAIQFVEKIKDTRNPSNSASWNVPSKTTAKAALPSTKSSFSSESTSTPQKTEDGAFRPFTRQSSRTTKEANTSRKSLFERNFLDDDDWISFENSTNSKGVSNFFALD